MSSVELLSEKNLLADPLAQYQAWMSDARRWAEMDYPEAAVLSTVSPDGLPEGRVVLVKSADERGFAFYTNMLSPKGLALKARPAAALTFYWPKLMRQVRVAGSVEMTTDAEADAYWATRPREARLGAVASDQSAALESRSQMEARVAELSARFGAGDVPRPRHWTGCRVVPRAVEFWQDGMHRLHDRFRFTRIPPSPAGQAASYGRPDLRGIDGSAGWVIERLWP